MMTMSGRAHMLNSIDNLKRIDFGRSVPTHSLILLHWFANKVDIDNNNVIWLTFDPDSKEYGSHHYGNFEGLLDPLPLGYRYYTVGNLTQDTPVQLPDHVVKPPQRYVGRNKDRIIIRAWKKNTGHRAQQRIDQVYITQHYTTSNHQNAIYDPAHTYQIGTNLFSEIRKFSVSNNQSLLRYLRNHFRSRADDFQLSRIRNEWGDLASLGLLLFIVTGENNYTNERNDRPGNQHNHGNDDTARVIFFLLLLFICILPLLIKEK